RSCYGSPCAALPAGRAVCAACRWQDVAHDGWGNRMKSITDTVTVDDGVALVVTLTETRDDAPALLLVHGFGGAKEDFADHVEALAREHRVVVFDHRGHGESEAPDDVAAYSLDRLALDTVAVADAFGFDTFRLLGHSMGGMVA